MDSFLGRVFGFLAILTHLDCGWQTHLWLLVTRYALRGAVKELLPDSVVQRCLVHKERNIGSKLSKKHRGEPAYHGEMYAETSGAKPIDHSVGLIPTNLSW